MSNEDEETLLEWGASEVKMFHDLKHANLLDPWRDMVDRAIKLMTGLEAVDEDWCDNYPAFVHTSKSRRCTSWIRVGTASTLTTSLVSSQGRAEVTIELCESLPLIQGFTTSCGQSRRGAATET